MLSLSGHSKLRRSDGLDSWYFSMILVPIVEKLTTQAVPLDAGYLNEPSQRITSQAQIMSAGSAPARILDELEELALSQFRPLEE
jgi:hypothetical protein